MDQSNLHFAREDAPTYLYSKILVNVINKQLPEASARAARARTFRRVQGLFSTNQMPLLLLSKKNAKDLVKGKGVFKKFGAADAKIIYYFDDLVLLAELSTFCTSFRINQILLL